MNGRAKGPIVVVSLVPPDPSVPHGFAGRAAAFVAALAEVSEVTLVRVDGDDFNDHEVRLPANVRMVALDPSPEGAPSGLRGMVSPLPRLARRFDTAALAALVDDQDAVGVVLLLPGVVHAAQGIDPRVPVVAVIDEGLERQVWDWMAPLGRSRRRLVHALERLKFARIYRGIGRRGATVVAISEAERKWLARFVPRDQIQVVPHGIDTRHFSPDTTRDEVYDVGVIADHRSARNRVPALELVRAASTGGEASAWRWVVGGMIDDEYRVELPHVTYTGYVDDLRAVYDATRVVVVPTREGTGAKTTVLQAWAMQKPLVATSFALRGLPARDGSNVLVAEDDRSILEQVDRLLQDPALRTRLAANGRETVCRERDAVGVAQQLTRLCLRAFDLGGRRSDD